MKSIELFCASPASTAICSSMDQRAMVRHRHIRRLGGETTPRSRTNAAAPCYSQIPFDPSRPSSYHHNTRKTTSSSSDHHHHDQKALRRKSAADVDDLNSSTYLLSDHKGALQVSSQALIIRDKYMDSSSSNGLPAFRSFSTRTYASPVYQPPQAGSSKLAKKPSPNLQIVELKVSIHCKGCEGKLRKHISRMEGVTSFSIDLERKKVTVMGDVTPVGVLSSISKVKKNAQFWQSPPSSSSTSSPRLSLTT